jgi:hypothetical protein
LAGNNPASCREKNTPTPELIDKFQDILIYKAYEMII